MPLMLHVRPMRTAFCFILCLATPTLAPAQSASVAEPTIRKAIVVTPQALPEIIVDDAGPDIFPAVWRAEPVNANARPLDVAEQPRSRDILEQALAKYPSIVVRRHLRKVYVVSRLEYFGIATGGTNSRTAVYVANNGKYRSRSIEEVFHAEFSSILLRNRAKDFDEAAWRAINPPDFAYRGNGVQAIKKGEAGQRLDSELNKAGFVIEYAESSLENDFNAIAGRLFMGDDAFWRVAEQYPKVMAKVDLAIAFYAKLDASFTKEKFLSLRQPEPRTSDNNPIRAP